MNVLVIVPAYNEEQNILSTVADLRENAPMVDYIVINDGSKDDTGKILDENDICHIDMPINVGLTGVVRTGMEYACKKGYDAAIQFDGDGQHDARYISDMIECYQKEKADIVVGSRFVSCKKSLSLRGLGGALITGCIFLTTHKKITDPTSGMRLFSKQVIKQYIAHMNYSPEPDTLALLMNRGMRVVEIPVVMRERIYGTSYLNATNALKYMWHTIMSILVIQWICE